MAESIAAKLRDDQGLTQKELAKALGISEVYVRKIEKGASKPGRATAEKYVRYFGIPANQIFPDVYAGLIDTKRIVVKEATK